MSTLIPTASGAPAARSASTAASSAALPRAITATLAPSAARVFAIASPMPLLPPVTTAFDPVKPRSIDSPLVSVAPVALSGATPSPRKQKRSACSRTSARSQSPAAHCRSVLAQTTPCMDCASVSGSMSRNKPWSRPRWSCSTSGSSISAYAGWISSGEANICDCASSDMWRRSDLMCSSNARSSRAVDPCGHRLNRCGGLRHFASEPPLLSARHLQKDRRYQLVLRIEMSVERPCAQAGAIEDHGDAEAANTLFANRFRCGSQRWCGAHRGRVRACRACA